MEKKNLNLVWYQNSLLPHYWYPVWTVPSNWILPLCCNTAGFFSTYLKFIIPLMILAYVTMGIADLSQGAGQLLLITVALAYGSTLLAGTASYLVSSNLFPHFMTAGALDQIAATADASLKPYFSLTITPLFDTLSAVVLAFILGLCLSTMKSKEIGNSLYNGIAISQRSSIKSCQNDHSFIAIIYLRYIY